MLNSGSLDSFVLPLIVVLFRTLTAYWQAVFAPRVLGFSTRSPRVIGCPALAAASRVMSSVGFCLPPLHDDQFFQKPMVSAMPPGGGLLSMSNVDVCPAVTVKSEQTTELSPLGL